MDFEIVRIIKLQPIFAALKYKWHLLTQEKLCKALQETRQPDSANTVQLAKTRQISGVTIERLHRLSTATSGNA
jgi:hypothetical protein